MLERMQIVICGGETCQNLKSLELKDSIENAIDKNQLSDDVMVHATGCFGLCERGPIIAIYPDEVFYEHVQLADIDEIINSHIIKGVIVERLRINDPITQKRLKGYGQFDVFRKQKRITLRNCGVISPLVIEEYIARDGYFGLAKSLFEMSPKDVVEEIKASGLRGRGGGGFPTGLKWEFAHKQKNETKFVICNADEGDPGAFMDRAVLEGDPHSILEAMAICGYAIGAKQGYIYVRAEYPVAIERLNHAIKQAYELGLLGEGILGSSFSFDIELRLGSGAFVCGEETALISSIEGNRGMPRLKPPFPAVSGLWGKPTNVNNVETFANVPVIMVKGANWFRKIGTKESPGTKVFALGGKIKNTGLIEVPMGTTLREVVYDIGGGIPNRKKLKAIQTGGPSGGCITASSLDTPIDFDTLKALGSMMGSGGMIIMDEDNCMVDVARFYLDFTVDESCGKCTPCREGTKRMLDILNRICEGDGSMDDLDKLEELAYMVQETSLCGLGQTAPNPVLTTIKYFRNEYEDHIYNHTCTAKSCKDLFQFVITDNCTGCTLCARKCPVDAITGTRKEKHLIDQEACIKCGKCEEVCNFDAIIRK